MKIEKFHNIIKDVMEKHGEDLIVNLPKGDKYKPLDKVVVTTEDTVILDFFGEYFRK
jgi:hypothetical protein